MEINLEISCPLCNLYAIGQCKCDSKIARYYHPDLEIDAEVRKEIIERDEFDKKCGIQIGWHKLKNEK